MFPFPILKRLPLEARKGLYHAVNSEWFLQKRWLLSFGY